MKTAVRRIHRAQSDYIDQLASYGVATVHEAQGRSGLLPPDLRPIYTGCQIAGSAVTVLSAPADNWMIHATVEMVEPGDILVVASISPGLCGGFGELLATSLQARGCRGLVTDSGVRDVAALKEMNFPVWSRAIYAQGAIKETVGSINVPIVLGSQRIVPGDAVVADDDGVVIVPRRQVVEVVSLSAERINKEEAVRARLANGELGVDIYAMREKLAKKGLRYVDGPLEWGNDEARDVTDEPLNRNP